MAEDPSLRVMWLVHMQSLADQAITTFVDLAEEQESSFTRRARIIHSGASARTTLADQDTDLVALTYHQLRDLEVQEMDLLKQYFQRPTIVVVDEAHHVASTKYEQFLDVVEAIETTRALIGLTATPPSTSNARRSFTDRFPTLIHQAGLIELIEQRILARPDVTTIDTGFELDALTPQQLATARADDIPAAVLRQLNKAVRNERVVAVWRERKDHWGRTLVFASNIDHADRLQEMLEKAGADCRVLHSGVGDRSEVLDWFRTHDGEAVLVSVGMLNEGVDLPKAETAFLVRATTSPVLMQQMIGRVLRGPKANGSAEAHIVHFRDNWVNLPDVLSPRELLPVRSDAEPARADDRAMPFLDDDELDEMADIDERLRLQFAQLKSGVLNGAGVSVPVAAVRDSRLLGFYRVDEFRVPVLDHQLDGFLALMSDAAEWSGQRRRPPVLSYFDDSMPPVPPARSLEMIRAVVEEAGELLELEQLDVVASPRAVAERIVKGDDSAQQRWERITAEYQRRFVRAAFATLDAFAEAVDREERELRRPVRSAGIEGAVARSRSDVPHRLRRAPQRKIKPVLLRVADQLHDLVPGSLAASVDRDLDIDWTVRVTGTSFAHWSRKQTGKGAGREAIRVNRLLQASKRQVGDEILEFLVYHELLHHLLPGNGHDSYFRELEARWPGYEDCNKFLDTLHEEFDTKPESYRSA